VRGSDCRDKCGGWGVFVLFSLLFLPLHWSLVVGLLDRDVFVIMWGVVGTLRSCTMAFMLSIFDIDFDEIAFRASGLRAFCPRLSSVLKTGTGYWGGFPPNDKSMVIIRLDIDIVHIGAGNVAIEIVIASILLKIETRDEAINEMMAA
jgi:hypothetical protein